MATGPEQASEAHDGGEHAGGADCSAGIDSWHRQRRTAWQFATTSNHTADAKAFAQENRIMLHDTMGLLALIASRTAVQQKHLLEVAFEGDYGRPTCVSCGIKFVERTKRANGEPFWGCANYPRCSRTCP